MAYGLPQKIDVFVWLHLAKDFRDTAFGVDDKSGSLGAHVFLAEEILFHPHAVTLHQCLIRIGKERERQPEFIDKFLMTSRRIHAHTKNLSTAFHFFPGIAQAARLRSAARRIVLWIKIENDAFTTEIRKLYFPTCSVFSADSSGPEFRRSIADLEFHCHYFLCCRELAKSLFFKQKD